MSTPVLRKALRRAVTALCDRDLAMYDQATEQLADHDEAVEFGFYVLCAASVACEYELESLSTLPDAMSEMYGELLDLPESTVDALVGELQGRLRTGAGSPQGEPRMMIDAVCALLATVLEKSGDEWDELLIDAMESIDEIPSGVVRSTRTDEEPEPDDGADA